MQEEVEKKTFVSLITAVEWVLVNSSYFVDNAAHRQSMCWQTNTPRISDTKRRIFSNSTFARVMEQYAGSAVVQVSRLFNMLTVAKCSETRFFRPLTNYIFRSL